MNEVTMGHTEKEITTLAADTPGIANLKSAFHAQRAAFLRDGTPTAAVRIDRINRAISVLVANRKAICEVISADFSSRAHEQSMLLDVYTAIEHLKQCKKHLRTFLSTCSARAPKSTISRRVWSPTSGHGISPCSPRSAPWHRCSRRATG
jgi:acyl-CoA reductase-like NAD-dependent aldehyde dehydrogenase